MRITVDKAVKLVGITEIGTYPTPEGSAHFFYENDKVVVVLHNELLDENWRVVYNSLEEAQVSVADMFY